MSDLTANKHYDSTPVFYKGVNRRGYCAYCIYGLEARDSLEYHEKCHGCKWTDEKKNWSPMPDFDAPCSQKISPSEC